jgi:excisionase family DNA binding protein
MTSYNAVLTLPRGPGHEFEDLVDKVHGTDLDYYGVAMTVDERRRPQIVITVEALDLRQATATARAVLVEFADPVRLEVVTTAEYAAAAYEFTSFETVTQAAERLGISRQAVLGRIRRGNLPARKIGRQWAIGAPLAA